MNNLKYMETKFSENIWSAWYTERDYIDHDSDEICAGYGETEREAMLDLEVHYSNKKEYWLKSIDELEKLVDTSERINSKFLLRKFSRNHYQLYFDADQGDVIYKDFSKEDIWKVIPSHDSISARIIFNKLSHHYNKRLG